MPTNPKLIGLIGICNRARRLVSGGFAVEKCVKDGKAKLVLIDENASANTKKQLIDMCEARGVPTAEIENGALDYILDSHRVSAAITDEGFARKMLSYAQE